MKKLSKFLTIAMMFIMTLSFSITSSAAQEVKEGEEVAIASGETVTVTKDAYTGDFYYRFTVKDKSTINIKLSTSEEDTLGECHLLDSKKQKITEDWSYLEEGNNQFLLSKGTYYVSVDLWYDGEALDSIDSEVGDSEAVYIDVTAKLTVKKYKATNMGGAKKSKAKKLALNKKSTIVGKAFNQYSMSKRHGMSITYYKVTLQKAQKLKVVIDSASASGDTVFFVQGTGKRKKDFAGAVYSDPKGKSTTLVMTDSKDKAKTLNPGTYIFEVYCRHQNECISFMLK